MVSLASEGRVIMAELHPALIVTGIVVAGAGWTTAIVEWMKKHDAEEEAKRWEDRANSWADKACIPPRERIRE